MIRKMEIYQNIGQVSCLWKTSFYLNTLPPNQGTRRIINGIHATKEMAMTQKRFQMPEASDKRRPREIYKNLAV